MSTYLGQKGYTIYKESLDVKEQILIRKELEVDGVIIEDKQEQTTWKYK